MFKSIGSKSAVQLRHADEAPPTSPGKRTLVEAVQARAGAAEASEDVHAAAARGIATPAAALPFAPNIQQLFGRHDVSAVQAHTGPAAADSARAMGAQAYATGNHVVLGAGADLHTVAHEAAHVVQQRAGVHLQGGVGAAGDAHEQHADAVADRVVRGESAESLLDRCAGGGGGAPAVQRKWVDKKVDDDVVYMRWQQEHGDTEQRPDAWHVQLDGEWQPVDTGEQTDPTPEKQATKKRANRWDGESSGDEGTSKPTKTTGKTKKAKTAFDPKIELPRSKRASQALEMVNDSEVGRSVMQRAMEASKSLQITVGPKRTQTHLDYNGDRGGKDQINLDQDRIYGEIGSIAQQLVMELTNLANKHKFWALDYAVQNSGLAQEAYVEANERIEYGATLTVVEAWTASNGSWGKSNHEKVLPALTSWETWWDHLTKNNPKHLDVYREGWQLLASKKTIIPKPPDTSAPSQAPSHAPRDTGEPSHVPSSTPTASRTGQQAEKPQSFSLVSSDYGEEDD